MILKLCIILKTKNTNCHFGSQKCNNLSLNKRWGLPTLASLAAAWTGYHYHQLIQLKSWLYSVHCEIQNIRICESLTDKYFFFKSDLIFLTIFLIETIFWRYLTTKRQLSDFILKMNWFLCSRTQSLMHGDLNKKWIVIISPDLNYVYHYVVCWYSPALPLTGSVPEKRKILVYMYAP